MKDKKTYKTQEEWKLEGLLRDMYQREAEELKAPDEMWEEIRSQLVTEEKGRRHSWKLRKRTVVILAAAMILVFGTITCYACIKRAGIIGYVNVKPYSTDFSEFKGIARASGYRKVKAIESFSNGFDYVGVWVSTDFDYDEDGQRVGDSYKVLKLKYRNDDKMASITIYPEEKGGVINPKRIVEVYDWDGITVYQTIYIHFEMPMDWEDKITEEQKRLLDEGIADGGVDDYRTEIIRHDIISFQWEQGGYYYNVSKDLEFDNVTAGDLEVIAREMVEANR